MEQKIKITLPILVEGKYDKITLKQIFDATVITLGGFEVFNSKEKKLLIRRISENGIIVLTDSDGGGKQIRGFISSILPKDKLNHVYVPKIKGKERRKSKPSKEGVLGVEGMGREELVRALAPFIDDGERVAEKDRKETKMLTKVDFYLDKLTGHPNSKDRRAALCREYDLPEDMTPNALLEALNLLSNAEEYKTVVKRLFGND